MLEQVIFEPTKGDNILDLCFTSHPGPIRQYKIVLGLSDHKAVIIIEILYNTSCILINKWLKKYVYCYNRTNWDAFHDEMTEISRYYFEQNENNDRSVEDNWNYIWGNLLKAIIKHPLSSQIHLQLQNIPWMTSQLKRLMSKKQQCYNKAKRTKWSTYWAEYKSIQGQIHQSIHTEHQNYIAKILM